MKKLFVLLLLLTVLLSGCIDTVEIETNRTNCLRNSEFRPEIIELVCKNECVNTGHPYYDFKCSEDDKIICICEK